MEVHEALGIGHERADRLKIIVYNAIEKTESVSEAIEYITTNVTDAKESAYCHYALGTIMQALFSNPMFGIMINI